VNLKFRMLIGNEKRCSGFVGMRIAVVKCRIDSIVKSLILLGLVIVWRGAGSIPDK